MNMCFCHFQHQIPKSQMEHFWLSQLGRNRSRIWSTKNLKEASTRIMSSSAPLPDWLFLFSTCVICTSLWTKDLATTVTRMILSWKITSALLVFCCFENMLHFPLNNPLKENADVAARLRVCLCSIHYEFLITFEPRCELFQPSDIFLHRKMIIFYCKCLPPHPLLIFSKLLYSWFTFNSMFFNENNDFVGEQYELIKNVH